MTKTVLLVSLFLSGCSVTPFIEGGLGYSGPAGWDNFDETGASGRYGLGVEFDDERWYTPSECGYYHRSMLNKSPEIVTNDWVCMKRITLGRGGK